MNRGIQIERPGIGVMLLGIALSAQNGMTTVLGVAGFGLISAGCFWKDRDR